VKLTFVCYKVQTVDGNSNRMVYVVPSSACKVNVRIHQLKLVRKYHFVIFLFKVTDFCFPKRTKWWFMAV